MTASIDEITCGVLASGSVGMVTAHGSFDVFFNICLPEDHPLYATYGAPEGFQQINLADRDMESIQPIDHRGRVVVTQSISQKKDACRCGCGPWACDRAGWCEN